ncbi:hypothetical protein CANINC_002756 [Pichia inconspicua]|uniref:PSP proline-rich domain-containing protein n=1 Tax=Pichia inconspicua TaxID=52247 RepID=A0A4T0X0D2_9ASCO|nr:hypothetical protein CANINC_002756 [[Candida] inconspicua]
MGVQSSKSKEKKKSKNQIRRERAKLAKLNQTDIKPTKEFPIKTSLKKLAGTHKSENLLSNDVNEELLNSFKEVFEKFQPKDEDKQEVRNEIVIVDRIDNVPEEAEHNQQKQNTGNKVASDGELSKRKFKRLYSIPLYMLKAESKRPELVEWMDSNSPDPRLHVYLKTLQNSVDVPTHWSSKKSFLSAKRAIERPPFQLPDFILETGILEMRDTTLNEDQTTLKQRMRERVQPKSGQLDIDYDKLYDAFFKYQKKPFLLKFGRLFNENSNIDDIKFKEKLSQVKIGTLSRNLKLALGLIDENGTVLNKLPPWYTKFEELGPPPSYPHMKILPTGQIIVNSVQGRRKTQKHWGVLINDVDVDEESPKKSKQVEEEQEVESKFDKSRGDIMLSAFGDDPAKYKNLAKTTSKTEKDSKLYKILDSTEITNQASIFGSKAPTYKL